MILESHQNPHRSGWGKSLGLISLLITGGMLFYFVAGLASLPLNVFPMHLVQSDKWIVTGSYSSSDEKWFESRLLRVSDGRSITLNGMVVSATEQGIYWIEYLSSEKRVLRKLDSELIPQPSFDRIYDSSPWRHISISKNNVAATIGELQTLQVFDTRPNASSTSLNLPQHQTLQPMITSWCTRPDRLFVLESNIAKRSNAALQFRISLVGYEDGRLSPIGVWNSSGAPQLNSELIATLNADQVIEFRNQSDGLLANSISPSALISTTSTSPFHLVGFTDQSTIVSNWTSWYVIDHRSGRLLASGDGPAQQNLGDHFFTVARPMGENVEYQVFDSTLGTQVSCFSAPRAMDVRVMNSGRQLALIYQDESVSLFDTSTNQHIGTWRGRSWVAPFVGALAVCVLLFHVQIRHANRQFGLHPMWSVAVWNLILFVGLLVRFYRFGSLQDVYRPINLYFHALAGSWMVLVTLWFVFGRQRLAQRFVGLILTIAGSALLSLLVLRSDANMIGAVLMDLCSGGILLVTLFYGSKWLGWRPFDHSQISAQESPQSKQWQLRDLFAITAAMSLLFAAARLVESWPSLNGSDVIRMLCIYFAAALAAVITAWAVLSRRWICARLIFAIVCVGLLALMPCFIFGRSSNWYWHMREIISIALFSGSSLWLIRSSTSNRLAPQPFLEVVA